MYSIFQLGAKYLRYYFTASNGKGHGIHSPFVFEFVKKVLNDKFRYDEYLLVEKLRSELKKDFRQLEIVDLGAGSTTSAGNKRSVSEIARHAAKPARFGQLLFRISRRYRLDNILELGTSLGITTAYLTLGNPSARVTTIEGSPAIAEIARENLSRLSLQTVEIITGNFDSELEKAMRNIRGSLMVFIDGNHRRNPTLEYFNQLLPMMQAGSMIIFDDIHWSEEMEEAWAIIRAHPRVKLSVDLFFIGIVFFNDEFLVKQEFIVRF